MRWTDIPRNRSRRIRPGGRRAGSYRMGSLGAFVKENKCSTKPDVRQDFSKPLHGRNRRGADGPPPWRRQAADIGRGGRRPPLPVRKTGGLVSWNRGLLRENRGFFRKNRGFLRRSKRVAPRSIESGAWPPWESRNRKGSGDGACASRDVTAGTLIEAAGLQIRRMQKFVGPDLISSQAGARRRAPALASAIFKISERSACR